MKYTVRYSGLFKRSFKKCMKRGLDLNAFQTVVEMLASTGTLWEQYDEELVLVLVDTGTHSDIFK